MAVSIVRGPDGRQHEVQHPKGIAPSQIVKYAQQQIASASNAEDAFVVDVGKGLFAGGSQAAVSSAAGVTQWMGQSFGSDSLLQAAEDMRQYGQGIAEDIGLDEDFRQSFFGQVVQGLGQVPVTIGAGAAGLALAGPAGMIGAAAITTGGQMSSEFLTDMEGTLGKGYTEFNPEEKANALTGMLAQTALGTALETVAVGKALKPLLRKLETTGVSGKALKKAIGEDRNALRELVEAAGAEGLTEAAQGQSLDTLASMLYDEERELITMDTLKRRAMEFGVGAVVGGTVSGGAQILGNPEKTSTTKKDLKKPVSERAGLEVPRTAEVQYKELDGQVRIVPIALGKDEDPITAAEEALRGRYDEKYGITVTEVTSPQPLDVVIGEPEVEPDVTTEEVPVQPEAAIEPVVEPVVEPTPEAPLIDPSKVNRPPVVEQDPMPTLTQEEFDLRSQGRTAAVEPIPVETKAPVETPVKRSFSLPQNLKKGKPGYRQTQGITFASDLERAAYSATTSTRSEPGKRKRESYRKILQDAGYSTTEINEMGREVRSQMRDQYDGAGSELSVDLNKDKLLPSDFESDITANAANELGVQPQVQFDDNEALNALPKKEKAKFNRHKDEPIERGAVRLNLGSAFSKEGVPGRLFVQTLHPIKRTGAPDYGKAHSYGRAFTLRNATFSVNPFAKTIIRSKADNKYPMASVDGDVVADAEPNLEGEVLSFNPFANDSFVDSQGRVVTGADEVTVYGTKAYARGNIQYAEGSPEVVTASEILSLAKQGKKYVHPKFHPKGIDLSKLNETQIKKLKALSAQESNIENQLQNEKENTQEQPGTETSQVPAGNRLFGQPLQDSTSVSERYQRSKGIRGQEPRPVVELDEERAAVIGKAYDKMKHDPTNPEVVRAYDALVKETIDQYDAILEDGYAMELSEVEYNSSQDMIDDVRNRKVMRVFSTEDGFGTQGISAKERRENPMLAETSRTDKNGKPLLVNDIFRFVHDFFGHGKLGNGFGPIGEENAWNVHSLMFSPLARRALTTETRGQNSWVNFSGVNDKAFELRDQARKARADGNIKEAKRLSKLAYGKMKFADQKIGLLPSEFSESTYQEEVTAEAAQPEVEDRGPQDTFANGGQVMDFVESTFDAVAEKVGVAIRPAMGVNYTARYNATQQVIEYNPMALLNRSKSGVKAAMREEIIHASMHQVLMQKATKGGKKVDPGKVWVNFFDEFAKTLTAQERVDIGDVYQSLTTYSALGAEYSRAVVQNLLYGEFSEQYVMQSKGGPAWNRIVDLLRSVQAYMAKVLGPMRKTNPEAAQVIVDSVELLKAADPDARPKNQQVVAEAYDAVDNNTAKENTEAGESVDKKASERIREERKWWSESSFRKTASKYLTPIITRLNRINPKFGRILQGLDTAIRERSFGYRKQTEAFFNKLNAVKGAELQELKQMLFFSPTTEEANIPSNKAKLQRRDALLHKHGLLNMYRLDVQPILEEIYAEYTELGMPRIGYLEDYFPRVVKDLEGLIKSYGHKTKRTFEMLVREENLKRAENKDADGNSDPLPEMADSERARFFQDFLQNKFRVDINGARLPGNIKVREIQLIPDDKLKYYDDPGIAFGKYTSNMSRAIESFKVVGDTRKDGELGILGKETNKLFEAGQIDQADADELKTLTELITAQFATENEILKSLGTLTYMATLINPGPVLVQIMDLYKVALYRGLGGVVSGTYRTVTGNRRFDIEKDFSIAKTQLSAEFEDPSVLQKALDFGLSRLVPFRQMDTAMKHASIEAAYDDFVKKAKAPVGSKKYEQLLRELTITMGREDALKTISDLKLDKAMDSALVKEALLSELLQRQPLTYLQVPEGYQTDPSKRLFYKLSTFMLLDLNYNRQEFMNDLGGPGKTLKQRTVALRRLAYMATLLTMFGLPSDMLDDWIAGKDTYIPEHVMNNMLGMFGLSKYTTTRALEKGTVESVIQRFTPPAINIMIKGESSLRSWVKGDTELFEMKVWQNAPLSDVLYYRFGAGKESQRKYRKEQRKKGITPTIPRS